MDQIAYARIARSLIARQAHTEMLSTAFDQALEHLQSKGLVKFAKLCSTQSLHVESYRQVCGAVLIDPVLGNCQVQLEVTISWLLGFEFALVAYALPPGPEPLPHAEADGEPILRKMVDVVSVSWGPLSEEEAAETSRTIIKWTLLERLQPVVDEFCGALDEAMRP